MMLLFSTRGRDAKRAGEALTVGSVKDRDSSLCSERHVVVRRVVVANAPLFCVRDRFSVYRSVTVTTIVFVRGV